MKNKSKSLKVSLIHVDAPDKEERLKKMAELLLSKENKEKK